MKTSIGLVIAAVILYAAADVAYPNNPECGWGNEIYRATGDWSMDAGSSMNWDASEPKGVMRPTHERPCEYKAVVSGLKPGKTYNWKVTIGGDWNNNWGCVGHDNPPPCVFQADSNGGVTFVIIASYAYPLSTLPGNGTSGDRPSPRPSPSTKNHNGGNKTSNKPKTKNQPTPTLQPPSGGGGKGRSVFAHYMMGFTSNSDSGFFQNTIAAAQSVGIDAFAVNVGSDGNQMNKMQVFLEAAKARNFKLFISLDMDEIRDVNIMSNWINRFADHPAYFRYKNRPFVSTFGGQDANFGLGSGNAAWQQWKSGNVGSKNIYFCPNFFGDLAGNYNKFPVMDCLFSWDAFQKDVSNDRDIPAISAGHSKGKTYMSGVAPWFFCHLPQYGKNWFWPQGPDNGAANIWSVRWMQAIKSAADFVEIITWNDYTESSYIAPLSQEVPGMCSSYVNGMDHSAFLKMAGYYIPWFKNGAPPALNKNSVYWWYRIHGKNQGRNDGAGKPTMYWSNPSDCVSVQSIAATAGAVIDVNIGGRSTKITVTQTLQDACVPYNGVGAVRVTVSKNGQSHSGSSGPDIQGNGNGYNFNVWSGSLDY